MSAQTNGNSHSENANRAMMGGLTNPVFQSQKIFRAVMNAMARPGTIHALAVDAQPPAPMMPLTAGLLATLADADTPLWLGEQMSASKALTDWLTFHVGAPFAAEPLDAAFAILPGDAGRLALDIFSKGVQDYPDRSATLIIEVESLSHKADWFLSGPGIRHHQAFSVSGLSPLFLSQWQENQKLFPRGVDVIFVEEGAIACMPRTTAISLSAPNCAKDEER
ncbi:phosphonate C-P lyase system protein PhnH [uncultured Cohaesibacter sp.]|uniref:phosphonate C-P lyase system protein PhnH n=1 Tax=uncultured Cohaesibacter sp. TaxID=1002546 RepID=UPI0029C5FBE6|nr:phosphonate C-P lyase system protein PhnH [uncultured Cohaesibacter sp.]